MMTSAALLLSLLAGVGAVTVIRDPPSLAVYVGETANISCDIINVGNITNYHWYVNMSSNPSILKNNSRMIVTQNVLTIKQVTLEDGRLYTCAVMNKSRKWYWGTGTRLSVTDWRSVLVIQDPPFLSLSEGDTARMVCGVTDVQAVEVVEHFWYVNRSWNPAHLKTSSRMNVTLKSLTIFSVTPNDTGLYTCAVGVKNRTWYTGNGTYLLVTGMSSASPPITQHDDNSYSSDPDHYLYAVIPLLVLVLVVLVLYWKCSSRRGSRKPSAKKTHTQGQDAKDVDLLYSTVHVRLSGEEKSRKKTEDEVEYAAVRRAAPKCPTSCDLPDTEPGNVCYATLMMTPSLSNS